MEKIELEVFKFGEKKPEPLEGEDFASVLVCLDTGRTRPAFYDSLMETFFYMFNGNKQYLINVVYWCEIPDMREVEK